MSALEQVIAKLNDRLSNQWAWIEYLNTEREAQMRKIEELESVVADFSRAVSERGNERRELESRIGAAADKLREAHNALFGQDDEQPQPAANPAPEPVDQPVADPMDGPA